MCRWTYSGGWPSNNRTASRVYRIAVFHWNLTFFTIHETALLIFIYLSCIYKAKYNFVASISQCRGRVCGEGFCQWFWMGNVWPAWPMPVPQIRLYRCRRCAPSLHMLLLLKSLSLLVPLLPSYHISIERNVLKQPLYVSRASIIGYELVVFSWESNYRKYELYKM